MIKVDGLKIKRFSNTVMSLMKFTKKSNLLMIHLLKPNSKVSLITALICSLISSTFLRVMMINQYANHLWEIKMMI